MFFVCSTEKSSFLTQGRHGYSVQFSPVDANCLAVGMY